MKIKSLNHVGITVSDFEKAVRWYWDVFRMPLLSVDSMKADKLNKMQKLYGLKDVGVKFGFLRCPKGGVVEIFEFTHTEPMNHCWNRPGTTHFTLDVKNVKKWYDFLKQRNDVEILCEPQNTNGNEWFFFRDPDGNLIELMDLKLNYILVRYLGKLVGFVFRKTSMKEFYRGSGTEKTSVEVGR